MSLLTFSQQFNTMPQKLLSAIKNGTLGHAYIFHGNSIDDIYEFSIEWIKACTCQNLQPEGACGACRHCLWQSSSNYAELHILNPESKSRQITIDNIRDFQSNFYMKVATGTLKVGLIVEADRMNAAAQNAFLKTLEEPPPNTLLVLITSHPELLFDTIKSRCRSVILETNQVKYDEDLLFKVSNCLQPIQGKDGAAAALKAIEGLKTILDELKTKAETLVSATYEISVYDAEDATLRKRFEEKLLALTTAKYISFRQQVISMVEVWLSQNYLLSNGKPQNLLTYPTLVSKKWNFQVSEISSNFASMQAFRVDFESNLNEDLAIENFFLQICKK